MPGKERPVAEPLLVRVAGAQMITHHKDIAGNINKALDYCDQAGRRGVRSCRIRVDA